MKKYLEEIGDSIIDKKYNYFHTEFCKKLRKDGWEVIKEYPVNNRGDGTVGRIDIVAYKDICLALELENKYKKLKSRYKLEHFKYEPLFYNEDKKYLPYQVKRYIITRFEKTEATLIP